VKQFVIHPLLKELIAWRMEAYNLRRGENADPFSGKRFRGRISVF
jgi:hypothetical protein